MQNCRKINNDVVKAKTNCVKHIDEQLFDVCTSAETKEKCQRSKCDI